MRACVYTTVLVRGASVYIFSWKRYFRASYCRSLWLQRCSRSLSLSHKKPLSPAVLVRPPGDSRRRGRSQITSMAPAHKSQTTAPTYQQLRKDLLAQTDNNSQPSRHTAHENRHGEGEAASSRRAPNKQTAYAQKESGNAPPTILTSSSIYERPPIFFLRKLVFGMRPRRCEIEGSKMWSTLVPDPPVGATYCGCMPRTS